MIIDGKKIAKQILSQLKKRVANLAFRPVFCDIIVGNDPVSMSYVSIKAKRAQSIGLDFKLVQCEENITTEALKEKVSQLSSMPNMCGLIIQLPLPEHINKQLVLDAISSTLDVDVLGSVNAQNFYKGDFSLLPPTAAAIMEVINNVVDDVGTKHFLVVGKGDLVGKPIASLLLSKGYSVTNADQATPDLPALSLEADVIISGTGKVGLITGDMIKPGAVVIDAGTAESSAGISGDVDFNSVAGKAAFVSPVPGGLGPVTVAKLLENVVKVAESR